MEKMRSLIKNKLKALGIEQLFYLGNGAMNSKSEIHFRINKNKADLFDKSYAIQFEEASETIAIWDLRKRLQNNASLDLYTQSVMYWEKINRIYVQEIALNKRNSGITSKLAIMPFSQLDDFLRFNKLFYFEIDIDNEEFDKDDIQSVNISGTATEGRVIEYYGKRYERNAELREKAIKIHGHTCEICGFNYLNYYGEVGKDYIEVHHIKPLYQGERFPNPQTDMISVCANCHRMLHRNKYSTLSPEELKRLIVSQDSLHPPTG
ncbi:MAG: HNH endonuclease [Lachnospiraceae bacterium]|nr:HNH endonuclease [Lachnospiraceae bacterium]